MSSGEEISRADYQVLAELRYQLRRFLRLSKEAVRARGLKPQQHQLLRFKATIGELAKRLQLLSLTPAPAFLLVETSI